eukprot:148711_1
MSRDLLPNTPQYAKIHEFLHTLSRDTLPNIPSTHLANKFNHDHLHSLHDEGKDIVRAYRHVLCCQILNVDHTKPIESHLSSLNNCSCNTDVDTQMHALQSIATPSTYDALFQSQIRDILHQYASNPFTHATLNPLLRTYTMNAANPNQMDIDDDDEFIDAAALDDPNDPDWVPPSSIFPSDQVPRQSDRFHKKQIDPINLQFLPTPSNGSSLRSKSIREWNRKQWDNLPIGTINDYLNDKQSIAHSPVYDYYGHALNTNNASNTNIIHVFHRAIFTSSFDTYF